MVGDKFSLPRVENLVHQAWLASADALESASRPVTVDREKLVADFDAREQLRAGREAKANEQADKWCERFLFAVKLAEPKNLASALAWAQQMEADDVPQAMSDWLLDSISETSVAEAMDALKSGILGRSEAVVKAEAYVDGHSKGWLGGKAEAWDEGVNAVRPILRDGMTLVTVNPYRAPVTSVEGETK